MNIIRFKGPAAYVSDLDRSRDFYENLLGLTVGRVMKRGEQPIAVAYAEGLSIWLASDAYASLFGDASLAPTSLRGGNWENTFETPAYEEIFGRLQAAGARFLYPPRALPWGQLGFRVYDPDGHIIDISETQAALVRRLAAEGMSHEAIAAQVSLTPEQIDAYLDGAA